MDAKPHTHQVEIKREWSNGTGGIKITYGDTTKLVNSRLPFLKRRTARGIRRAIRKHDKGSIRAGKRADKTVALERSVVANANSALGHNQWGSGIAHGHEHDDSIGQFDMHFPLPTVEEIMETAGPIHGHSALFKPPTFVAPKPSFPMRPKNPSKAGYE